jgi:hypothetical protein
MRPRSASAVGSALTLTYVEFVERLVNLGVKASEVCSLHITFHEETEQIPQELGAKIVLRNVSLD